jgi:hypothetical protein
MKSSALVEHNLSARKVLVDLDDLVVVLDRQTKELRWDFPPYPTSRWSVSVAIDLIHALETSAETKTHGLIAHFARSGCHVTVVDVSVERLVQIQTFGRFESPMYKLFQDEARAVAAAMSRGLRELRGRR